MAYYTRGKPDASQKAIIEEAKAHGLSVINITAAGRDACDLLIGAHGVTLLVEAKSGKAKLEPHQAKAQADWRGGPWLVWRTPEDVQAWVKTQRVRMAVRKVLGG
jgi:Holliday junction resolvase